MWFFEVESIAEGTAEPALTLIAEFLRRAWEERAPRRRKRDCADFPDYRRRLIPKREDSRFRVCGPPVHVIPTSVK